MRKRKPWTAEEDAMLADLWQQFGPGKISQSIEGTSTASVKARAAKLGLPSQACLKGWKASQAGAETVPQPSVGKRRTHPREFAGVGRGLTVHGQRGGNDALVTVRDGRGRVLTVLPPRTDLLAWSDGRLGWWTEAGRVQLGAAIVAYLSPMAAVVKQYSEAAAARFVPTVGHEFTLSLESVERWLRDRIRGPRSEVQLQRAGRPH